MKTKDQNNVLIIGEATSPIAFKYSLGNRKFYSFKIAPKRRSGVADELPVIVPELVYSYILNTGHEILAGLTVSVKGSYRSRYKDGHSYLYIFSHDAAVIEGEVPANENSVFLSGYVVSIGELRSTPDSKRNIIDIHIAVHKKVCGKWIVSDYIPIIAWGKQAMYAASALKIGSRVAIQGRVQSRDYQKKFPDGTSEWRKAYEVSAADIKEID